LRVLIGIILVCSVATSLPAKTWSVEKDGSSDFTVIQDALDAAAPGDSVLVGPGRFDDFRPGASTVDGFQFQMIAWITTSELTLLGAGTDLTTIGPDSVVTEVVGRPAGGLYIDGGVTAHVEGFTIENEKGPVTIRNQSVLRGCVLRNPTGSISVGILEGFQARIENCQFFTEIGIVTASPAVRGLIIANCDFLGNPQSDFGVVIGNGSTDAVIRNCTFDNISESIQFSLFGSGYVEDCKFTSPRIVAIHVSSGAGIVRRCRIEAGAPLALKVNDGRLEVYDTVVGGGTVATIFVLGDMVVRDSHILNGGALSVDARGAANRISDLAGNWWGTADLPTIRSWISTLNDNVIYEPILSEPVPVRPGSMGKLKGLFYSNDH